ncbi:rRNA maturation RNase YbeY [Marinilabilia rubra]|uniref:Endoribonuclease YbeY n=1 Tax=Marinilabilia rubra TaxID=2162893 RepID=A0A2U2B9H7_9BACT|nr:rRNA maturation RNase YbeY [Marinilabilia rubra]PWD99731.1 rRNA maturation RNase YbeY [Marinilabilia rubra]
MAISFSTYDVSYNVPDKDKIDSWICEVIENEGYRCGDIHYVFCSDEYILKTNREYLNHDYTTDIITFDYSTRRKISGDVIISIPTVSLNAERYNVSFHQELLRVIIHGILHLIGYKDATEEEKEQMRKAENLSLLFFETNF